MFLQRVNGIDQFFKGGYCGGGVFLKMRVVCIARSTAGIQQIWTYNLKNKVPIFFIGFELLFHRFLKTSQ